MDNVAKFVAQIQANIRNFERNIKRAQAQATALPDEIEVDVEANISKFRRGILQAEALAKRFSARNIVKNIDVRWKNARRGLNNFIDDVDKMNDNFQNEMVRLARMISAVGTVIGNVFRGGMIASFSALIPIVAGLTSVIMTLGNVIGVTVGNLLALVGAFGIAGLGVAAYGGLIASVLARYNDEAFEATEASQAFTRALDSIKSVWSSIVDENIDKVFMTMGQAIYAAQFALEAIIPFINQVVDSVRSMTNEFKDFTQESPTMLRFFDNLNTKGVGVFENITRGAGQFGKGLIDVLNAAMPLIEWVAQGFENMGTSFANWADKMAETNGFHTFIEYVKENMPKISGIFSDAFYGIIDLFAAFGENTSTVLDSLSDMMERFREWSATIKESDGFQKFIDYIQTNGPTVIGLIGSIVMMIVNFAIAMAPIAEKVLEVVAAIAEWTAELFKSNPIIAQIIGVIISLAGVFMMLLPAILIVTKVILPFIGLLIRLFTNSALVKGAITLLGGALTFLGGPISIVIAAITALVAIFIIAYQEIEWFRNIVNQVWTFVTTFIQERIALITETFNKFREEGQGIFEALWNTIVTIISEGLAETWEKISTWVTETLEKLRVWGEQLVENIRVAIGLFVLAIVEKLIEAKEKFTTWVSETIDKIIEFGSQLLENIRTSMEEFKTAIQTKLSEAATILVQKFTEMVTNARNKATEIVTAVRDKFTEIKTTIQNKITEAKTALVNKMTEMATNARTKAQEVYQNIKDKISEVPSMVGGFISDAAQAVRDKASEFVSAGGDLILGLIDGIKGMAQSAVDAVTGVVGDAIDGAKSLLGINSPSRVFRSFGEYTMQGLAIGIERMASRAVGAVTDVARDMTNSFAPDLTTTADIDGQIGNFNRELRSTVDADIQSGIETQRPIVNVTVRNEGDVEMIRSAIQLEDGIDETLAF